jgi:hypothetical protein
VEIKQIKKQITMEHWTTTRQVIKEFCEKEMSTHTDWTGTRVETKHNCESVEAFVNKLMEWIEDNHYRC